MNFELTAGIKSYLQGLSDKTIVIGFSGGPDSVATYQLISNYYQEQSWNKDKIYLAHFNHKARIESNEEADFIKKTYNKIILGEYQLNSNKEADYRRERHSFFKKCLTDVGTRTLILGHNLSDRLETTLLNIERGAGANGIGNMQEVDHKEYLLESHYLILRPLLSFPKHQIIKYCEMNNLQYFTDKTNTDITISKRNKIRAEIIKPLEQGYKTPLLKRRETNNNKLSYEEGIVAYELFGIDKIDFRKQLEWWYQMFYTRSKILNFYYKKIDFPSFFGFQYLYQLGNIDLVELLKAIGEYSNTTTARLQEYLRFIHDSKSGYIIIGKWKLYSSHERFYLVLENSALNIGQVLDFWIQSYPETNGKQIRMINLELDYYKGKPINKYLINNKVPVFMRKLIPVLVDENNKVIQVLIQIVLEKLHDGLNG